jgi:Bifunctional DNA primase/polymerase, N-terminal
MMTDTCTLDKALALAQRGLPVFFCGRSKRPTLEGGFHNATTRPEEITRLYEKAPGALIGVPTGIKFCVVDPDLQHKPARQWLKANKHRIPITRTHRTASGGLHLLFKPHPDFRTGVTVDLNVDCRGLGGYVIWWPAQGYPVFNPNVLAEVPDWIIKALPAPSHERKEACATDRSTPIGAYLTDTVSPDAAFAGILSKMAQAKKGERQNLTFWCANRTCELIRDGLLSPDALTALEDVALSTGIAPDRVAEVLRRVQRAVL